MSTLQAVHALTDTLLSYAEEARLSLAPRELGAVLSGLRLLQRFLVEDPTGIRCPTASTMSTRTGMHSRA